MVLNTCHTSLSQSKSTHKSKQSKILHFPTIKSLCPHQGTCCVAVSPTHRALLGWSCYNMSLPEKSANYICIIPQKECKNLDSS